MRGRRGRELAAGEIEVGSACWYLLNSHRGGGGGFVFTLFYSVVARISQTPELEDHTGAAAVRPPGLIQLPKD